MKNFYIAVMDSENGLDYAYMIRVTDSTNLYATLSCIPGIIAANIAPTKKAARATVQTWRDSFRINGTSLLDTLPDGSPAPF